MSTRNSRLLVYECENMKFTCNFSIIYTYRLRVRESKHSLYISRLRVQKDSIIRRFNHLWVRYVRHLRVREVNLVYEYTHSVNDKCCSSAMWHVHRPFASFPNLRVVQNAMVRVQMKRVRYQKLSGVNGSLKHASLPSRTAFVNHASPRPYHPNSPPLLSRHLVWCKNMRWSLW